MSEYTPDDPFGPYLTLSRAHWARLAASKHITLDAQTLASLRGVGDPTDFPEVEEVYLPLTQLIQLYMERTGSLFADSHGFLGITGSRTPFVIGIAGSVAVGKSTVSRLLRELLAGLPGGPKVDLVTTDGFLYPNAVLEERGLMDRKGFPESYNRRALLRFVMDVKSGEPEVRAPVYSHVTYDIVPGREITVTQPDILIVEGLNVLQPARPRVDGGPALAISDFFDFSIYVDADEGCIRRWYIERLLSLRETAFREPDSYFARYANLTPEQSAQMAVKLWDTINGPNLKLNIQPTLGRATIVLRKDANHHVAWVRIRRI
ncbi:MAG: type I pantothenate kinase [Propionibacteriaceae bacterium]|jgi:type I pantothenate kinase|nr:type I pantothenate kinase [Propionibacteriaceae bacterium]